MTAACAPVSEAGAIPESCAARTPRISSFWLAYAAGQEEAVAAAAAFEAMPMDAWLALSDAGRAAIVAASLAPSGAAPRVRPRSGDGARRRSPCGRRTDAGNPQRIAPAAHACATGAT